MWEEQELEEREGMQFNVPERKGKKVEFGDRMEEEVQTFIEPLLKMSVLQLT